MATNLNKELGELFSLPLAEFTPARNVLAGQLKKQGKTEDAAYVKALSKPPVSAWAVNQLFMRYPELFERLTATGEEFRKVQSNLLAGKGGDLRATLEARRDSLVELSKLAAEVLREAGHAPTRDKMQRIATTLEAMSAQSSLPEGVVAGQLTDDVDPPGFDVLGDPANLPLKVPGTGKPQSSRENALADARAALQKAELDLKEATTRAREAQTVSRKARTAAEAAIEEARRMAMEAEVADGTVVEAERLVEKASRALLSLEE